MSQISNRSDRDSSVPELPRRRLVRWMFGFLRPVKALALQASLVLALFIGAEILTVRQTAEALTRVEALRGSGASGPPAGFWNWLRGDTSAAVGLERAVLLLLLFSAAMAILACLREVCGSRLSMNKVFYIREAIYDKLQRVGLRFHDRISTGELINRALTDLQHVRTFVQSALLLSLEIALIVGGYIILLLSRSPWLALLALAPVPPWIWYILRFSRRIAPAQQAVMEAADNNVSVITENLTGVHVVKASATEPLEIARFEQSCSTFLTRTLARIRLYATFIPTIRGISMGSHLALALLAAILFLHGKVQVGDFLLLGTAMGAILGRLQQVAAINEQYQNALVSARRLHEVLAAEPTVAESRDAQGRPAARPLPAGPGAVRFEHVTFGYDPQHPVLHDISFEAPGGSTVALVGPTGAGKTTLMQLLARFYDAQAGRILIDGMDVRDAELESLRTQVAFVFQETYLFSDSVQANIAYSRPAVTDGEIEAVSRLAQAHEFVDELPGGYRTRLGERGASLSGGQRQRLAIARAILANPRVLILDDATASVDPETEELIHRGTRYIMKGRTTFVIAHRLNTVRHADLVLVLERGRLTQSGTHAQLMMSDGHYRDIAAAQLREDEELDAQGESPSHLVRSQDERKLSEVRAAIAEDAAPASEP